MSTDPAAAISAALHANDISQADLRQPTLLEPTPRRPGTRFAVATVTVAVAALAGVLALVLPRDDHRSPDAGGTAGVIGYRWTVTRIHNSALAFTEAVAPIKPRLHASIGFTRDGYVVGDDSVNALQGHYTSTARGYRLTDAASTLVGIARANEARTQVINGVDAMFFSTDGESSVRVVVTVHGDTLTLRQSVFTLTLRRAGVQSDFQSGPASATSSRTG